MKKQSNRQSYYGVEYEKTDWNVWAVCAAGVGIALLLLGVYITSALVMHRLNQGSVKIVEARVSELPPEPRLQVDPAEDLQALRREEETVLNQYAWVDRTQGIVRIPIDRAIQLVAQNGLPARPAKERP